MHKRNETDEIETDAYPRPKPLDELGGSHKWESGGQISLQDDCPATGKARGSIGLTVHFWHCKLLLSGKPRQFQRRHVSGHEK